MNDVSPAIVCIGPSHKTASLAARERFALVGAAARELTTELHSQPDVLEVVGVATCNRSELYVAATDVDRVLPVAVAAFARFAHADVDELSTMLAVRVERAAVEHLFRVASGVESVIIGEAQIQGQLKQALEQARLAGTAGPLLDRLFRTALEVGKRARSETAIGAGRASVGSVATALVERRLGTLAERSVLLIGAGKMSGLVARGLAERGAASIEVANRNVTKAAHLAEQCGGSAVDFADLEEHLASCDVVVSSTSAPHAVLDRDRMQRVVAARSGRPLVLVDLAVPRDIEHAVGELPGCHLYDLDDLEHDVAATMHERFRELDAVTDIVDSAAEEFLRWRRSQNVVPAIMTLRRSAEGIRLRELQRFEKRLAHLAAEDRRRVEQLTRSIVNKLLHQPTVRLREAAGEPRDDRHEDFAFAVEQLFGETAGTAADPDA